MAELVDALVSKTSDGNIVPVRGRLQVRTIQDAFLCLILRYGVP